jgi:hypothetical protein
MASRLKPLDLNRIETGSVRHQRYLLTHEQLGAPTEPAATVSDLLRNLPRTGEAETLRAAAALIAECALAHRPLLWVVDGGWFDAGLAPMLTWIIRSGLAQGLALSGEAALLDFEMAQHGHAHEDARAGLVEGTLGLARETGEVLLDIINDGVSRGFSIGECLGRGILDRQPRFFRS